jgi:hypothetical protein
VPVIAREAGREGGRGEASLPPSRAPHGSEGKKTMSVTRQRGVMAPIVMLRALAPLLGDHVGSKLLCQQGGRRTVFLLVAFPSFPLVVLLLLYSSFFPSALVHPFQFGCPPRSLTPPIPTIPTLFPSRPCPPSRPPSLPPPRPPSPPLRPDPAPQVEA